MLLICLYEAVNGYQIQSARIVFEFKRFYVRFFMNKTLKLAETALKIEKEDNFLED